MLKYLQILKTSMDEGNKECVVEVNYKALIKLEKTHDKLLKSHDVFNDVLDDDESYGDENITVNFKQMQKFVEEHKKSLETVGLEIKLN